MFASGCNYSKLETNSRLAIHRLKMLKRKRTELVQKSRKEIADYMASGQIQKSKIRVELIIQEDYFIEALELIETYCDLISARFGILQQVNTLDDGLSEAVSSLLWAAPRLQTDVPELKVVADQLALKLGRQYAFAARENAFNSVDAKLVHKLSIQTPTKILVEKYLMEIAKSHNVPYKPDAVMLAEKTCTSTEVSSDLIELDDSEATDNKPPQPISPVYPSSRASWEDTEMPSLLPAEKLGGLAERFPNEIGFNVDTSIPSNESSLEAKFSVSNATSRVIANFATETKFFIDSLPELPSVPSTLVPDVSATKEENNEIELSELEKRFEELKKRD